MNDDIDDDERRGADPGRRFGDMTVGEISSNLASARNILLVLTMIATAVLGMITWVGAITGSPAQRMHGLEDKVDRNFMVYSMRDSVLNHRLDRVERLLTGIVFNQCVSQRGPHDDCNRILREGP